MVADVRSTLDTDGVIGRRRKVILNDDRYFDADKAIRRVARALYAETRKLPIVSPHGHVDPRLLADDVPFPEPVSLIVSPDHYILRMLYARGIPLDRLGVPWRDGTPSVATARSVWQLFADHIEIFRGTPTGSWLDYELHVVFGLKERLTGDNAAKIYDQLVEKHASDEFRPRALFDRFQIELLATTDKPSDPLQHHTTIRRSGWQGRVIPTFRPDALFRISRPAWRQELADLEKVHGAPIESCDEFVHSLQKRRVFFKRMGATATDHGVMDPYTAPLPREEAERLFQHGRAGQATADDQRRFEAHLLMEMARLSQSDGLIMQLHVGAFRDHNAHLFEQFGADVGGDIPVASEFTRNLRPLLNAHGNDPRFTLILFTLDESTYSRELAPLAGHYPSVRLGAPWWFHDSIEGMTRFRERTTETAGIDRTVGFTDDTRAFCSIPARHDLSRRVDANWLARLVSRHVIGIKDAREWARMLAYDLAKSAYRV